MKRQVQKRLWPRRPSTEEIAKRAAKNDDPDLYEKILVAMAKKTDYPIFSGSNWYLNFDDFALIFPGNALGIDSKSNIRTIPEKPDVLKLAIVNGNAPHLIGMALSRGNAIHIEFCGDYLTANCIGLTGQTTKTRSFKISAVRKAYNV